MIPKGLRRRHLTARHSERTARRVLAETKDWAVGFRDSLETYGLSSFQIGVLLDATGIVKIGSGKDRIYTAGLDRRVRGVREILKRFSARERIQIVSTVGFLKLFQGRDIPLAERRLLAWRKKRRELLNQIQKARGKKEYEGD